MPASGLFPAALLWLALAHGAALAQPSPAAMASPPPAKVRELLSLMDDAEVREWLGERERAAAEPPADPPLNIARDMTAPAMAVRQHVLASLVAVPTALPELARAGRALRGEIAEQGPWATLLLVAAFLGLGLLVERLYWRATAGFRERLIAMQLDTVEGRLKAVGRRLLFGLGWIAAFAVGSLGAFLLFDWPPLLHGLIARCLLVVVVVWLTTVVLRFILAPGAERFRILPLSTASARHWYKWLTLIVGWYTAARLTVWFLADLGLSVAVQSLLADVFSLVWLLILLLAVWRRPALRSADNPDPAARSGARTRSLLMSCGLVLVWLLVPLGAYRLFSTALVAAALPVLLVITNRSVAHILRPPGTETAEAVPPLAAVLLQRGLRALWIIGAALLLGWIWKVDVTSMTGDATLSRLLRGVLHAVVILLVIDLLWHALRSWIDRRLAEAQGGDHAGTPEVTHRRARIRTLLPIARNVLLVVLAVMGVLMALSALGVEVGPLIAGAGVVGVAIGFGSQTLVKDVISGVFFLLDDAFRVGEYIESGSIRGTVEGFSLRSIKLRHHRGYLHTVPFGSLDMVTNYSRDWVIDKVTIGVTYDTDLDQVKRLVKQVGKELLADPELAPNILDTLKMQGVEEYGDFAIKIRLKLTTKPGEQFVIRRRAYALIKQAFDANGIKFAFPTVQVAGGEPAPAAAQAALDSLQKPAA
ncbi:MAG TPA: mechanosensitive ion channel family protein [Geminicoccaceae bacterium]|nr:mechanosensitive ion channel family protein [Geminicoccaceae bacterium]